MNKTHQTVMAALAFGLQACVPYYNSQATLEALAVVLINMQNLPGNRGNQH
jgi:uncharacterized protein YraI